MAKTLLSKKGLSGVITVVIMIALVMAAAAIVWGIVNNTLKDQVDSSKSCFGNFNKITINPVYTCYEYLAATGTYNIHFSLSIGDIEVDDVLVSIASEGETKGYTITNTAVTIPGLANYDSTGFGTDSIKLPGKNSGLTYVADGYNERPDLIQIAPTIDEQQCEVFDTLSGIESCSLLN